MDYRILSIVLLSVILAYVLYRAYKTVFGHPDGIPFSGLNDMFETILVNEHGSRTFLYLSKEFKLYSNMAEAQTMQVMPELYGFIPGDRMVLVPDYIVVSKSDVVSFGRDVFDFNLSKKQELIVHTSPGLTVYHQATIIHLGSCHVSEYGIYFDSPIVLVHPEPTTLKTADEIRRHMSGYGVEFALFPVQYYDLGGQTGELTEWLFDDFDSDEEDDYGVDDLDGSDEDEDGGCKV